MSAVSEADRPRRARLPAVLDYAFRPMFLAAGSWAVIALALWLAMFFGYVQLPTRFDPLAWHVHEMLFGFVMAAVAGFLLTAIPNWTGRLPVRERLENDVVALLRHGRAIPGSMKGDERSAAVGRGKFGPMIDHQIVWRPVPRECRHRRSSPRAIRSAPPG